MSTTRVLSQRCIGRIVADVGLDELLDQLIERLAAACQHYEPEILDVVPRDGFRYRKPDLGLVEWMPVMELGRYVAIKTVSYHPSNPVERGSPSIFATTSLHDTTDGRLLALCEATFLTAIRTGAASALATDILAPPDARILGVIGCGTQAVTQIHAISRVRPIDAVVAFDTDDTVVATLAERVRRTGLDVTFETAVTAEAVIAGADIVCTATSVEPDAGAVFADGDHRPWLHLNAVGADHPGKHEIPHTMLERATVCPDLLAQCLTEGECQRLNADQLGPELPNLVRQRSVHESLRPTLTIFDSTGWALEDLVAAQLVLDHAERLDEGVAIDLQPSPTDPYDPYEFLWS